MRNWVLAGSTVAVILALSWSGCGGDDQRVLTRVLTDLREAYLRQDYAAVCARMTRRTQREVGGIGHDEATTCERDMARRLSATVLSRHDLRDPEIESVAIDGDRAIAQTRFAGLPPVTTRLAREDGDWKLAGLFGTVPRGRPPEPGTNPPGAPLTIATAAGRRWRCPPLAVGTITVAGGCELTGQGDMTFTTVNVLGDRFYTKCHLTFTLHLTDDGRFAFRNVTTRLAQDYPGGECGDLYICRNSDGEGYPWRGHLSTPEDGRLTATVPNLCLDTCLGRFAGELAFEVEQDPSGRIAFEASGTSVGDSGLLVSGRWRLEPVEDGLRIGTP